jgi:hypothetical protein
VRASPSPVASSKLQTTRRLFASLRQSFSPDEKSEVQAELLDLPPER